MRVAMQWTDRERRLSLRLAPGSRMIDSGRRIAVKLAGGSATKELVFSGKLVTVTV